MMHSRSWKKIIVFLGFTFGLSSIFYYFILRSGMIQTYTLGLMWSPGLAALLTQLIFTRSIRNLGWKFGKGRYLLLAYLLPIIYGIVVYGIVWLSGIGPLDIQTFATQAAEQWGREMQNPATFSLVFGLILATVGVFTSSFAALGEEIGWRGFLVPELTRATSFTTASLVSGVIWTVWHAPIILLADYNNPGGSRIFGLICFAFLVIGSSFVYAWLRLKSGSLWPAVLLHASHNLFIQGIFTPLTGETALTPYVIDEFGIGLALVGVLLGVVFWRKGKDLEEKTAVVEAPIV
ncbi:MAG: CPBP family intramembrane metalloprotease [Anaerolineales bacterium]|nr:CPBP family intramembrane metalloprotease [Anaerolineales bacterium]